MGDDPNQPIQLRIDSNASPTKTAQPRSGVKQTNPYRLTKGRDCSAKAPDPVLDESERML